ncbi:MAG: MATE family efflux transporter [Oscillospiraceae bacterium]
MSHTDLTQGSIIRQLVKYSIPLVLSSLLQSLYGMVDMLVVGHYIGATGLSAVNNSSQVMLMITNVLIGICTGGNILIGQYFGAKDRKNCHESTVTLFSMSMVLGAVLSLAFFLASRTILVMLGAPALEEATVYLRTCSLGIIFIIGYNAASAALRAAGNSRDPLACIAVATVINIALDIVFVGYMDMGTFGAALATIAAQAISFFVSLSFVLKNYEVFGLSLKKPYIRFDKLKTILKLGIPCAIQMSIASISWLSVTYIINSYSVIVSAGNGVAVKIKNFCQLFIVAMCNASTAMIAQCIGAREYDRARKVMYTTMGITISISVVLIVIVELFAWELSSLFTSDADTIAASVMNLRIEILGQLFYASFLVYHTLALGSGHTWFAFFSSFVNCILVRVPLAFILNHFFGLSGLYWACMIAPGSSVPIGLWYERSNRWRRGLPE